MEGYSETTCYSLTLGRWWWRVQPLEEAFTSSFSKCTSNPSPLASLLPQRWRWPGIWRGLFVWFGKIRLHCGGCWAGQENWDKAVGHQLQIQWGDHKHLLLKWILMFANWLKAELSSLWRWGAGQTRTPLKIIKSSTFLIARSLDMIVLLGEAFLVIVGRWNPVLKNPFCVACLSFQIRGSSSFPRKAPVPLDIQLYWLPASSLFLRTYSLIISVWATQRLN